MKSKNCLWKIATIVWVAVIFSFSLRTGEESGGMSLAVLTYILDTFLPGLSGKLDLEMAHLVLRKMAHFTEYFVLGVLSRFAVQDIKKKQRTILALIFCIGIGVIDETLQLFVNGRVGSVWDVVIDSMGALVGFILSNRRRK